MDSNTYQWVTNISTTPFQVNHLPKRPSEDHPLKAIVVTDRIPRRVLGSQPGTGCTTPSSTRSTVDLSFAFENIDPLSKFAIEEMDPLSKIAAEEAQKPESSRNSTKPKLKQDSFESWESRKVGILNRFTTSEKISIITSFLSNDDKVVVKAQSSQIDNVQHRLEQLDYFEESSQKKFDLSQVEYVHRIEQLNKELVAAWNTEQKVKALKIAIQCAKLLSDVDVIRFYPSKFVLITDILDNFGKLVFERLNTLADSDKHNTKNVRELSRNLAPDLMSEVVKETCRNWFFKIASIRELVPRIFVEMAILKSYSFLTSSEFSAALMRITRTIRGIGNPLVSVYARCYLCRIGLTVINPAKENRFLIENFYDFLDLYEHLFSRGVKKELLRQHLDMPSYLTLYTPALDYILQAVAINANEATLNQILDRCQRQGNGSLLINTIMAAFKPSYISTRALHFLEVIFRGTDISLPSHVLLRTLGLCVTLCAPSGDEQRKKVLNAVWPLISRIEEAEYYINCAEPWAQFTVQYFMAYESQVNAILGDIVHHMSLGFGNERCNAQLKIVLERIIYNAQDIETLLAMSNVLPLIDLFQQETTKVEICKMILQVYNSQCNSVNIFDNKSTGSTSDPVIVNTLMYLCRVLYDSLSALTVEDERRQIGEVINTSLILKVDLGRDFERQLDFYVEARAAFSNLDAVLGQLVQCVNTLSVKTRKIVNGNHTRKTAAFVRACAAYCFITIPSIASVKTRLQLYLLSGRVALFNHCLGQADACFATSISTLPELADQCESITSDRDPDRQFLDSYVNCLLSALLVVPDSGTSGVLHMPKLLHKVLEHRKLFFYNRINMMHMLAAMGQEQLVYNVDKVESNDTLYGSDPKFLAFIDDLCTRILAESLGGLTLNNTISSDEKHEKPRDVVKDAAEVGKVALSLTTCLLDRASLTVDSPLLPLAYRLCKRAGFANHKLVESTKEYYMKRLTSRNDPIVAAVINRLWVRSIS